MWLGGLEEDVPVFMKDGSIEANNVPRITLQDRQVGGGREREAGVKHKLIKTSTNTHNLCVFVWFRRRGMEQKEEIKGWRRGGWVGRQRRGWRRRSEEEEEEGGVGRRKGGEEEKTTLCSISSSDFICLCSSTVASRASTFTAIMIFDGW